MNQADKIHTSRRMQHALTGILFYALSFLLRTHDAISLLTISSCAFYTLHRMRKKWNQVQDFYLFCFGGLLRESERDVHKLPGAFWFLLGVTIVFAAFNIWIARTSLLCVSLGDPMAAIVGIQYGHRRSTSTSANASSTNTSRNKKHPKSFQGSLACFAVCFLICMWNILKHMNMASDIDTSCQNLFFQTAASIITAGVVTTCEYFGSSYRNLLDDNILMPIGCASSLALLWMPCKRV